MNWFPKPSPLEAPFTKPAISTISTVAGCTRTGCTSSSSFSNLGSGTFTIPILGSMVQNGKLALCALALDKQLKWVDFPTFGNPTMPAFIFPIPTPFLGKESYWAVLIIRNSCKGRNLFKLNLFFQAAKVVNSLKSLNEEVWKCFCAANLCGMLLFL